jgi:hypothetical protein
MADYSGKKKLNKSDADEILKEARERWDRAYEKEEENMVLAYEDLQFMAGNQWPERVRNEREQEGRPVLTINRLPQFVHQITGDIRQMKPAIKVVPVDDRSDPQVANIMGGLIRYVENRSDASGIYFQAADQQVAAGIGHWRVLTEYADDSTFEQEIRIAGVDDGIAVLWDPDSRDLSRADAQYCFVPVDMNSGAFKEKYPDSNMSDFATLSDWKNLAGWYTDDHVRICEYWVKKPHKRTLALTGDGQTIDVTGEVSRLSAPIRAVYGLTRGYRLEERESYKVCRYLITAAEILEGPDEWAGRHIPIIPVIGEEVRIGRKTIRSGIVRHAKSPQQMVNYYSSAQTEAVALQPKAPFMVTEVNVAKYQELYDKANTKNLPYLIYEPDTKNNGAPPQRVQPPVASQGMADGLIRAIEDLKAVTGIYDASLGAKSNETSGKAILARQREGDVGSYVFIDNFARAIRRTGQILVDLIPHIYDTERTIRIMGEDGRIDLMKINQAQGDGISTKIVNDVTVGSYDVVTEIGPSYTTKREEAKEGMTAFIQAAPEAAALIGDLMVEAQDWPLKDKIAKRIRATLPQHILQAEEMEEQGASPEQVKQALQQGQQPPPDPKIIEMQAKLEMEQQKLAFEQEKAQADMQLQIQKQQAEQALAEQKLAAEIALKREELQAKLAIEQERMRVDTQIKTQQAAVDADLRRQDMEQRSKERAQAAKEKKKAA